MSILKVFSNVLKSPSSARTDNFVFHLHYRVTAVLLAAAAILIRSSQRFGKPISCDPPPPSSLTTDFLEDYCWTQSTFSLVDSPNNETYNTYYQWVWLVLTLQSASFYFSRCIWKKIDNGRVSCLVKGLTEPLCETQSMDERVSLLRQYVSRNWNKLDKWAYGFFVCEIINFVNVVAQICIIDAFFGGIFTNFDQIERAETMTVIFPRLTKCVFRTFGPSGDVRSHEAICVLPMNVVNEKIYVFLWFWLVVLAVPTGLVLVYRVVLLRCPVVRVKALHWRYNCVNSRRVIRTLLRAKIGDWLLLNLLAKNIDALALDVLLGELEKEKLSTDELPLLVIV